MDAATRLADKFAENGLLQKSEREEAVQTFAELFGQVLTNFANETVELF